MRKSLLARYDLSRGVRAREINSGTPGHANRISGDQHDREWRDRPQNIKSRACSLEVPESKNGIAAESAANPEITFWTKLFRDAPPFYTGGFRYVRVPSHHVLFHLLNVNAHAIMRI
jgi:hypothetical protein